jgi:hypothetical protein
LEVHLFADTLPLHRISWVRWANFCAQSAALPWIVEAKRLALRAGDDVAYRSAAACEARLRELRQQTAENLWALEPDWCAELPALRPWTPKEHVRG